MALPTGTKPRIRQGAFDAGRGTDLTGTITASRSSHRYPGASHQAPPARPVRRPVPIGRRHSTHSRCKQTTHRVELRLGGNLPSRGVSALILITQTRTTPRQKSCPERSTRGKTPKNGCAWLAGLTISGLNGGVEPISARLAISDKFRAVAELCCRRGVASPLRDSPITRAASGYGIIGSSVRDSTGRDQAGSGAPKYPAGFSPIAGTALRTGDAGSCKAADLDSFGKSTWESIRGMRLHSFPRIGETRLR